MKTVITKAGSTEEEEVRKRIGAVIDEFNIRNGVSSDMIDHIEYGEITSDYKHLKSGIIVNIYWQK